MPNYKNLNDLRREKAKLRNEVSEIEDLLKFKNVKDSLSLYTNGLSDNFVEEKISPDGETHLALKTKSIVNKVSKNIGSKIGGGTSKLAFDHNGFETSLAENALKLGALTIIGNIARKNMKKKGWKKKAFGFALLYLAPVVVNYASRKLENYQKNKSISSMQKLI